MLHKKIISAAIVAACLLSVNILNAQGSSEVSIISDSTSPPETEEEKTLVISGSVDAYYRYDFARQLSNNKTSFTNTHNSFAPGMASIKFTHTGKRISATADLGFGNRASEFSYNESGISAGIKQLFLSYNFNEALKVTAGTWATHVGYEVLDPQFNRNYSMSYLFSYGPFSHTGIKLDYTKGTSSFMAGISNPTDYRIAPEGHVNSKFFIAQYAFVPGDNFKLYLNYVGGKNPDTSHVRQYDAVAIYKFSDKLSIALNPSLNHSAGWDGVKKDNLKPQDWWGLAGYVNYDPKTWLGLTLRSEYFNDDDMVKNFGKSLFANTLSVNLKKGGFTFIPELRLDHGANAVYLDNDGNSSKSAFSAIAAFIYSF